MSLLSPPCWEPLPGGDMGGAVTGLTVAECGAATEQPRWALLRLLAEKGIWSIGARGWRSGDPWQWLAARALGRGGGLAPGRPGFRAVGWTRPGGARSRLVFAVPGGTERVDAVYAESLAGLRGELLSLLPEKPAPVVAIDFSLAVEHVGREARSLRLQAGAALGVVRRFLWDRHLLLAGLQPGVLEWLRGFLGSASVQATSLPADESLSLQGYRSVVLLDPQAPEPLSRRDVFEAEAFIIGGIVDILPRPGATRRLPLRGLYVPRRLELRGSAHGVPNRINKIVEIIMYARYVTCGDVEKAIVMAMSPRDARLRAYVELARWSRGRRRRVPWSLYRELASWLPLSPRDFIRAARMAGLEPEGSYHCPSSREEGEASA